MSIKIIYSFVCVFKSSFLTTNQPRKFNWRKFFKSKPISECISKSRTIEKIMKNENTKQLIYETEYPKMITCKLRTNHSRGILTILRRQTSTTHDAKSIQPPNPLKINSDMVGPPDPVSNLRKIIFREPPEESVLEKKYRELRVEVQEWNHKFWTQHNSRFFEERENYLKNNLPDGKQNLTADEMSVFYKQFLDKNWENHITYNLEWYKKNFILLTLALKIKLNKLLRIRS